MYLVFVSHKNHQPESHLWISDKELTYIESKTTVRILSKWHANMHPTIISTRTSVFLHSHSFVWWTSSGRLSFCFEWNAELECTIFFSLRSIRSNDMRRNEKWDSFAFYKTISRKVWHRWWQQPRQTGMRKIEMKWWICTWKWCAKWVRDSDSELMFGCIRVRTSCDTSSIKLMLSVQFCCLRCGNFILSILYLYFKFSFAVRC